MKNLKNKMKENKAITLISLVITIVILIILAGIAISTMLGNDSLLNRTKTATEEYNKQTATESINLKITTCQMNTYAETQRMPTLKELAVELEKDNEIQYVNGSQRVASTQEINFTNATSIFTKLKAYPYEFEINSSLQLASIDGVKIATLPTNGNDTQVATNNIVTQFYSLSNNISISNNSENNIIFDFSELDTGTYIINVNMYSNADANSNIFGYLQNSEQNQSKPSRFYFYGYNGYTVSNGSIVVEHTKNENMKFIVNSYCGKNISIDANNTNAVAIKIK